MLEQYLIRSCPDGYLASPLYADTPLVEINPYELDYEGETIQALARAMVSDGARLDITLSTFRFPTLSQKEVLQIKETFYHAYHEALRDLLGDIDLDSRRQILQDK